MAAGDQNSTRTSKSFSFVNSHRLAYNCLLWLLAACLMALICQSAMGQSRNLDEVYDVVDEKWRVIPLRPGATPKQISQHRKEYGAA